MIKSGEVNKQPGKATLYGVVKIILLLSLLTIPLALANNGKTWFSVWYSLILFIGTPLFIWVYLNYHSVSFVFDKNKIEINYGVLFKRSKVIMAKSIQNIKIERGLLIRLFGLSVVKIWTASPDQVDRRDNKNPNKPDGLLIIFAEDGKQLSNYWAGGAK